MREFKNKVALITGAANGFGVEFMKEAAKRKMKIAAVDIEGEELKEVCDKLREDGAEVLDIQADLTKYEEVERTVAITMETYGQIDLLMCNAGIAIPRYVWELPIRDWEWIIHINVMQHVYFMRLVIPIMRKQGTPCHICNSASVAGLITSNGMPSYYTTKHASVALAESVKYDLECVGADIEVSVFCPGFIQTDLHHAERHRPEQYSDPSDPYYTSPAYYMGQKTAEKVIVTGKRVDFVGPRVFKAIEDGDFYISTDPLYASLIERRAKNILDGRVPSVFDRRS